MREEIKMTVEVQVYSQSQPMIMRNVENTYTKDGLFCVRIAPEYGAPSQHPHYYKFPVQHIFRIKEYQ
jgi:hypothetical protein